MARTVWALRRARDDDKRIRCIGMEALRSLAEIVDDHPLDSNGVQGAEGWNIEVNRTHLWFYETKLCV